MTNAKSTKHALLSSVMALFLCFTMLLGTTFAWFTDTVTSGNNMIVAGNLDIELEYYVGNDEWETVNGTTNLFEDTPWEPGRTDVVYLRLKNIGSLALKYELAINIVNEVPGINMAGEDFLLSDYIYMGVVEGQEPSFENRSVAKEAVKDTAGIISKGYAAAGEMIKDADDLYMAVVVYMPSSVDNVANYREVAPSINLGINLIATQLTNEEDSFGKDYDEAAKYVISSDEEMIFNGATFDTPVINNGTVTMSNTTIDAERVGIENYGNATLNDVDVKAGSSDDYAGISYADSVTEYNNVNFDAAAGGIGVIGGAEVVFNSGKVNVGNANTSGRYCFYLTGEGSTLIINGGNFSFSSYTNKRAYIYADANTTVYVNGGTFDKASSRSGYTAGILGSGTVIITGGTFGFDPSNWLADGYSTTKVDGKWIVFKGEILVNNDTELATAIAEGKNSIYLQSGNYSMPTTSGDMTISGTTDTVITIGKPKADNVELNGVTVVGSGNYTGIQHSNKVVYENCVVKGVQFLYADEVQFINCTIDLTEKADYIWTYGAKNVLFDGCTFNTAGKAILVYSEATELTTNVTVKNCTFNASTSALAGGATAAAIEIDSSLSTAGHYTLTTENNIVDSDFSGEWRIKKSGANNTTVNGVVYNAITIDGVQQ